GKYRNVYLWLYEFGINSMMSLIYIYSSSIIKGEVMEVIGANLMTYVEIGGLFAPILFICFHLLRPFFFIPVVFICISGGILFGPIAGSIYSLAGITLSSIFFYILYRKLPNSFNRVLH